jgi:arsenate reductase (thioredoxin)
MPEVKNTGSPIPKALPGSISTHWETSLFSTRPVGPLMALLVAHLWRKPLRLVAHPELQLLQAAAVLRHPNLLAAEKNPMTTITQPLNVLFLCTHNSARSILAEAMLNHLGKGRFKAYSAGSSPRENQKPNPLALETLAKAGITTEGLYSKSWDEFGKPDAPHMDLVITVCDNAAGEVCPFWPGQPATAHWGYADPSEGDGDDEQKRKAFLQTLHMIRKRLEIFVNLPAESLSKLKIERTARDLAKS